METMIRAGRIPFALLVSLLFMVLLIAPAAPAATTPLRASFHECGDMPSLTSWDIRAKRVMCSEAKQVVRAYVAAVGRGGGFTKDVRGFHCKISGYYGDGAYYRCAAPGHRVVRFTRGG
jgi:hypothetical protein